MALRPQLAVASRISIQPSVSRNRLGDSTIEYCAVYTWLVWLLHELATDLADRHAQRYGRFVPVAAKPASPRSHSPGSG